MNFICDIWKWRLINLSNYQYRSFKNVMENQRNVTMTAYAVRKSNVLYAHGITAMTSACKWQEIFTVFSGGIMSDYN